MTLNFGIYNFFNSISQHYGLIGDGVYIPQNFFGLAQNGGATSGLAQSNEAYGLPFRSYWFTVKFGL